MITASLIDAYNERLKTFCASYDRHGRVYCSDADEALMFAARESTLSGCRSKRGVVIWSGQKLVGRAHNYLPIGRCDQSEACKQTCAKRAVHAEQGAMIDWLRSGGEPAQMLHVKTVDGLIVASGKPSCLECSKLIFAANNIVGVWLLHEEGLRKYYPGEFHEETIRNVLEGAA